VKKNHFFFWRRRRHLVAPRAKLLLGMEFRLEPALERRDPGSVITAIALDDDGGRIYVGEEKRDCIEVFLLVASSIDREGH